MSMSGELMGEKAQEKLFALLLKRDDNQNCADCKSNSPTWVSLDFGIFVCMNCSGAHRHLSRNVTRVYSIKIDSWNKNNFQIMDHVGNEIANSYWEFKSPTKSIAMNAGSDDRIRFVTDKYIRKLYANPKSQNPVITFLQSRDRGILERPYQNKENIPKGQGGSINEKEFMSNGAACSLHNEIFQRKQSEIAEKRHQFSSVNSPPIKPSPISNNINLLFEMDDVPKMNPCKQLIDLDEDGFANFIQAPQPKQKQQSGAINSQNQQKNSINLLDLYSKPNSNNQSTSTQGNTSNNQSTSTQGNTVQGGISHPLNMNGGVISNHLKTQNSTQQSTLMGGNLYNKPPTNNQNTQFYPSSQSNFGNSYSIQTGFNVSNNVQASQNTKNAASVDLMSLYNQPKQINNNQNNTINTATTLNSFQNQSNQIPNVNQNPAVDKNRFQAFNQMPQFGTYYPYYGNYQQQQQYVGNGMQNQLWK